MVKEITEKQNPYIVVRKSRIHGSGVFAKTDIPKGTEIIEYVGEKITKTEAERRAHTPVEKNKGNSNNGAVYLFDLNKRYDIDGFVAYNTARFINHSCEPNCESVIIDNEIWIVALRDIKKGEELSYNYGYTYDEDDEHDCYCGTDSCLGYILAEEEWNKFKRKVARKKNKMFKSKKT